MSITQRLPITALVAEYDAQAAELLEAHSRGDATALRVLHQTLPRFLDPVVTWKPLDITDDDIRAAALTIDDARMAVARWYSFRDWTAVSRFALDMANPKSPVRAFELAAEAVIDGDAVTLSAMLAADPALVHARSTRETCHDPCVHRATLLHYLGANGIEGYRQRSAPNAVDIARLLLNAGAVVDALADMYGGQCTTMSMLISSTPPAEAGVQVPLVNTLLDYGAAIEGSGVGNWISPIRTALIFGFRDAADAVAARATQINDVVIAAGLGRMDETLRLLPFANEAQRHEALALASQNHRHAVVALLLDAGVDPNRFNPQGMHSHQTPLHSASFAGDMTLVQLLVSRGARYDIRDSTWNSTAVGWAEHGGQQAVVDFFAAQSAR
jgi:Ankyrin repeats (3 copies)